ncbi:arginine--tRNA ligase [Winogradskyella echinorum]|uniref:Arginine--tRNA ligase n=1 Tax=Winogradskyella echinorum TaxID=538189 RepID=A0ABR6Y4Q5_9FLAO|nr:arginine--tRNA ligase [Winogradskyella echinorum]MBC3847679.1 arginine--tRNA ligase [Winogradskyella echinorum]MBC5752027.1 arginine--tRNA ligase [Winogradskyella echinorum]
MNLQDTLELHVKAAIKTLFQTELESVEFQATRKEFAGDITVVVFPMLRVVKGNPAVIGEQIGQYLQDNVDLVKGFNVVKGFLNVEISESYYLNFFKSIKDKTNYGFSELKDDKAIMVEYSSPNTNKPLHLGHVRNVLLGYSVSEILKASGKKVYKTQIINDRGIHICKSMLAWQRFGNSETPESTDLKGDKLVGNYYVKFDKAYKAEISELVSKGQSEEEAKKNAPILLEAQEMLRKWEAGDEEVVALWKKMNGWVYEGFEETYKNIGVDFDKYYYESETYLLGKEFIAEGLKTGVFEQDPDGSVWCDLTEDGLDRKIVLRSDGTAVYMTQDIGTAIQRIKDYPDVGGMVYTVGNEQDYHFKVLFLILKKLGFDWAKNLFHLSYGMVDLPSGKMKSREGTVVDADDLIQEMADTAEEISKELGKLEDYSEDEKKALYKMIGLGALKYYILKVDPKKRILFDPKESIDFQGNTGPFIQYTYARIQSILRKATSTSLSDQFHNDIKLHEKEKQLIKQLELFPEVIQNAASQHSPALIANFTYDLVKDFNSFYQNVSILGADIDEEKSFRVTLSQSVSQTIKNAFGVLGIEVPERM